MENFINYQKIKWSKTILLCFGILFLYNFIDNFIWEYAETTMSKEAFEKTSYYFFDTIVCILCFFLFFFFYWSFRKELKKIKERNFTHSGC